MPPQVSEAMLRYDSETGQVEQELVKSGDPPVGRTFVGVVALVALFVAANLVNVSYVEQLGGKVKENKSESNSEHRLYDQRLR